MGLGEKLIGDQIGKDVWGQGMQCLQAGIGILSYMLNGWFDQRRGVI